MFRFIFRLIPWWLFAIIAANFAATTFAFYDEYQTEQSQFTAAQTAGPPAVLPVNQLGDRPPPAREGQIGFQGTLRADLGIKRIVLGGVEYNYVVLDAEGASVPSGPIVAILIPSQQVEQDLTLLVNAADEAGNVTVYGSLRPEQIGEVSRQLAQSDSIARRLYVIEPYFGPHASVIASQVEDARNRFLAALGLTVLLAAMALIRLQNRRKRKRRAAPKPQAVPAATTPAAPPSAAPWGPQPAQANPTPRPQTMPRQTAKTAPDRDDPVVNPAEPAFKSVFPGAGSPFRFKTSDEIIRQSFGTFRTRAQIATRTDAAKEDT